MKPRGRNSGWNLSLAENKTAAGPPTTRTHCNGETWTRYSDEYVYPCTLAVGTPYCVQLTSPTSTPREFCSVLLIPCPTLLWIVYWVLMLMGLDSDGVFDVSGADGGRNLELEFIEYTLQLCMIYISWV